MSSFFSSPSQPALVVLDASVLINLNATGLSQGILETFSDRFCVTPNAVEELRRGDQFGHDDARPLQALIDAKVVAVWPLCARALAVYETLIDGSRGYYLDDGEAASIAFAAANEAALILDERKARRYAAQDFAQVSVGCTAQLLLHPSVRVVLGPEQQELAMQRALQLGRMRVPAEHVSSVVRLIGTKVARECPSLPRQARSWTSPP